MWLTGISNPNPLSPRATVRRAFEDALDRSLRAFLGLGLVMTLSLVPGHAERPDDQRC